MSSSSSSDTISLPPQPDQLFSELLSTLPKQCLEGRDSNYIYEYQGFWYPPFMLPGVVSVQQHFRALPTDIFVCGALKTGNTWLKSLCFAIATRNQYSQCQTDVGNNKSPLLSNFSHTLVPILELENHEIIRENEYKHNLLFTHIPYTSLPESVTQGCKIIYICRDPKDTLLSMFHFIQRVSIESSSGIHDYKLKHIVDLFCDGKSIIGPYWDHVLGYHKAGLERPEKFLFLTYEKLKTNTVFYVKKLAAFMDQPFTSEEESEGVHKKIVDMCSFENLRGLETNKTGKIQRPGVQFDNHSFFRKGVVGDWKNELSVEMTEKIDRITEEKLKGSSFTFS